jgi:hypothetical protein
MTNKIPQEIEDEIIREVLEEVEQNLDFTDGFREGRLYEREKVLKLIENLRLKYKGNSFISLIDEYSEELLIEIKEGEC